MQKNTQFTEEILSTLEDQLGITGDVAWFDTLKKSASSKNITIPEWNQVIWKLATTVSGQVFLKNAIESLSNLIDTSVEVGTQTEAAVEDHERRILNNAASIERLDRTTNSVANTVLDHSTRMNAVEGSVKTHGTWLNNHGDSINKLSQTVGRYDAVISDAIVDITNAKNKIDSAILYSDAAIGNLSDTVERYSGIVDLIDTALDERVPMSLSFDMDSKHFIITANLKAANGKTVTSATIDLPIESSITNIEFVPASGVIGSSLKLTLANGNVSTVPINALFDGIVTSLNVNSTSKVLSAATGQLITKYVDDSVSNRVTTDVFTGTVNGLIAEISKRIDNNALQLVLGNYPTNDALNDTLSNYDTSKTVDSKDDVVSDEAAKYTAEAVKDKVSASDLTNAVKKVETNLTASINSKVSSVDLENTLKTYAPSSVLVNYVPKNTLKDEVSKVFNANIGTGAQNALQHMFGTQPSWGLNYDVDDETGTVAKLQGLGECVDTEIVVPSRVGNATVIEASLTGVDPSYADRVTSIYLPDTVTTLGTLTRFDNLEHIRLPNITELKESAFDTLYNLQEIVLPESLISIGSYAFRHCRSLKRLRIPDSVATLGRNLTIGSGIEELTVGNGVTKIPDYAFEGSDNLTTVRIGNRVSSIGFRAFNSTAIETIYLPRSLTSIAEQAFADCHNLSKVYYSGTYVEWVALTNTLGTGNDALRDAEVICDIVSFEYQQSSDGEGYILTQYVGVPGKVAVPDTYNDKPVFAIGDSAFKNTGITEIQLSNNVAFINDNAFSGCTALKTVKFGTGIAYIGSCAFKDCNAIYDVHIPSIGDWCNVNIVDDAAVPFKNTGRIWVGDRIVADIHIPETVTHVPKFAFSRAPFNKLTVSDKLVSIGDEAFFESAVAIVELGDSVSQIGTGAFYNCTKLTDVRLPTSVVAYGDSVFARCSSLQNVNLEQASSIARNMFENCTSLTVVTTPTVALIPERAFYGCSSLVTVTVSEGVEAISSDAFIGCSSLTHLYLPITLEQIYDHAFGAGNPQGTIFYPGFEYEFAEIRVGLDNGFITTATLESRAILRYELNSDGVSYTVFGSDVEPFADDEEYTLEVPSYYNGFPVTGVGAAAFMNFTRLKEISLPLTTLRIGYDAFKGCVKLTSMPYLDELAQGDIDAYAFANSGLTSVEVPLSWRIGDFAFSECNNLTSATVYVGAESAPFGVGMFKGCEQLQSAWIIQRNHLATFKIPSEMFADCTSLEYVEIPEGVVQISEYAFDNCVSLLEVLLGITYAQFTDITQKNGNSALFTPTVKVYTAPPTLKYTLSDDAWDYVCEGPSSTHPIDILNVHEVYVEGGFNGMPVRSIAAEAFKGCVNLTKVDMSSVIENIGARAFKGCTSLSDVKLSSALGLIGVDAFADCPNLITNNVGNCAFLGNETFPELVLLKVQSDSSDLGAPTLSNTRFIYPSAFKDFSGQLPYNLWNANLVSIGDEAFYNCSSVYEVDLRKVGHLGVSTFFNCKNLTKVTLGLGNMYIPPNTFKNCNSITDVFFEGPAMVVDWLDIQHGNDALYNATWHVDDLGDVEGFPGDLLNYALNDGGDSYKVVGLKGTPHSALEVPMMHDGLPVTTIAAYCFANQLYDITLPPSITHIMEHSFENCQGDVGMPPEVLFVGEYAFSNTKLTYANFYKCSEFGNYALYNCQQLSHAQFSQDLLEIPEALCMHCKALENIHIPQNVHTIRANAFKNTGIRSVHIPKTVSVIENSAFGKCHNLTNIHFEGTPSEWEVIVAAAKESGDNDPLYNGQAMVHFS